MKIDLHGIKHADVSRRLDKFFWECMQKKVSQVTIVTGISPKMKEIVVDVCKEYKFNILELSANPGSLIVDIS